MNALANVVQARAGGEYQGFDKVRLPIGPLQVDPDKIQSTPDLIHQLVHVRVLLCGNRHEIFPDLLLDRVQVLLVHQVHLVQDQNRRSVFHTTRKNIDQLVIRNVVPNDDATVRDAESFHDSLDSCRSKLCQLERSCDRYSSLIRPVDSYIRRLLVQPNTHLVNLVQQGLQLTRLKYVQDQHDQVSIPGYRENSSPPSPARRGSTNYPGQVEDLNIGPIMPHDSWNNCQCGERVGGDLGLGIGQSVENG